MQATQLPRKMMEGMRLVFMHCAPTSIPQHHCAECSDSHICGDQAVDLAPHDAYGRTGYKDTPSQVLGRSAVASVVYVGGP